MPMLNNPQKVFHKGFENFTVAFLLESGYNTSEYLSREEYLDATLFPSADEFIEDEDTWEQEYEEWRDDYHGEEDAYHYHDPLIAYRY